MSNTPNNRRYSRPIIEDTSPIIPPRTPEVTVIDSQNNPLHYRNSSSFKTDYASDIPVPEKPLINDLTNAS